MERTSYELLAIALMAILVIGIVLSDWFTPNKKRNSTTVSHPTPLWRRWRPSNLSRCDCCRAEAAVAKVVLAPMAVETWSSRRSKRVAKRPLIAPDTFALILNVDIIKILIPKSTPWLQMIGTAIKVFASGSAKRAAPTSASGITPSCPISKNIPTMSHGHSRCVMRP